VKPNPVHRRDFLKHSVAWATGVGILGAAGCATSPARATADSPARAAAGSPARTAGSHPLFDISLAQWSLHRTLQGGRLDHLDFAQVAQQRFGVDAVEYVNQFFMDRARDRDYLRQMRSRAEDAGVRSLLIMCDREGNLGDPDPAQRTQAVENHYKWVEAAQFLGCHSIRVNAGSSGSYEEQIRLAADGLRRLSEFGETHDINVIVENHGGLSSNGAWLAAVMRQVDHPRAGTLPDFGNFCIRREEGRCLEEYDRYQGVTELMPYAKGVSAKSHDFNEQGEEVHTDYRRMMSIVLDAGYRGYVGIEYEGEQLGEEEGILATRRLLERVREELAPRYR
jgi:sugar phosphate isomerase/epimerase